MLLLLIFAHSAQSQACITIDVCFTPGENCTAKITAMINAAKKHIWIQASSFTSAPIAKAVVEAKGRGIDVHVILDKINRRKNAVLLLFYATITFPHGLIPSLLLRLTKL